MRISSLFFSSCVAPVILALTWGASAGQGQLLSGTWQMNPDKSHWGEMPKPTSVVLVIDHHEPQLQYQGKVTYLTEESRSFGFAGAFDGKPYRMTRSYGGGTIVLHRTDWLSFDSTFRSDDGSFVEIAHTALSKDGSTLTRKIKVQGPDGEKTRTEVYEKVKEGLLSHNR